MAEVPVSIAVHASLNCRSKISPGRCSGFAERQVGHPWVSPGLIRSVKCRQRGERTDECRSIADFISILRAKRSHVQPKLPVLSRAPHAIWRRPDRSLAPGRLGFP